jgi:hypothetical protein
MPYQVKAGSVAAIVANEKQALEMLQRLGVDRGEVSIGDVFGEVVDVATLRSQINDANTSGYLADHLNPRPQPCISGWHLYNFSNLTANSSRTVWQKGSVGLG